MLKRLLRHDPPEQPVRSAFLQVPRPLASSDAWWLWLSAMPPAPRAARGAHGSRP
jgi:hypothetical protein